MVKAVYTIYKTKMDVNGNSRKVAILTHAGPDTSVIRDPETTITPFGADGWAPPLMAVPALYHGYEIEITPKQYQEFVRMSIFFPPSEVRCNPVTEGGSR